MFKKVLSWFNKNLIIYIFIGEIDLDSQKFGTICEFKLFKNKYLSTRKATYWSFLGEVD